ncbi:MAG: protein-L-isoaspartate(D-aspartate) O-methyltransferase [Alphaproteobacteria bacterium]|nr:protein-L-isoaspartate(D-aspartate) O-methyltransferase [Alphaproteobacteria bacterium]
MDMVSERAQLILGLRQNGILNQAVLAALESIPRELFVPETFAQHAYDDSALPIGRGQTISQPLIVARMTDALQLTRRHKVLEIGTGSGYQAAVLSRLARRVYTIERHKPLLREAESLFRILDLHNISTRFGDGAVGWTEQAPFDRIIVTAAAPDIPPALVDQLSVGGRLVVPVGADGTNQTLLLGIKTEAGLVLEELGGVRFVPLLPGVEAGNG